MKFFLDEAGLDKNLKFYVEKLQQEGFKITKFGYKELVAPNSEFAKIFDSEYLKKILNRFETGWYDKDEEFWYLIDVDSLEDLLRIPRVAEESGADIIDWYLPLDIVVKNTCCEVPTLIFYDYLLE